MNTSLESYLKLEKTLFEGRKGTAWSDDDDLRLQGELFELFDGMSELDKATVDNQHMAKLRARQLVALYLTADRGAFPIQMAEAIFRNDELGLVYRATPSGKIHDRFFRYSQFIDGATVDKNVFTLTAPIPTPDPALRYAAVVATTEFLQAMPPIFAQGMSILDRAKDRQVTIGTIPELNKRITTWFAFLVRRAETFGDVSRLLALDTLHELVSRPIPMALSESFPQVVSQVDLLKKQISARSRPSDKKPSDGLLRPTWKLRSLASAEA